ncbi:MAG: glycosyltransferase family 4 protein [Herpetosiphon sp.]|nr:glycosyltransferase family 4 protein [Herpetosiphon sp.]
MNHPRLTILAPSFSYPHRAGASVHIANAVRELSRSFATRFYCLNQQPEAMQWGDMADWCVETAAFRPQPQRRLTLDPPAVWLDHAPALIHHCEQQWRVQPPDLVQIEFTSMLDYAKLARRFGAKVICTAHNVAFLAQIRRANAEPSPKIRLRRWLGALSLFQYELRKLRHCDLVITLNEVDRAMVLRWLPRLNVHAVPSGMNLSEWRVCRHPQPKPEILFVGNYHHPPNVEGALWLAHEVLPLVVRERPDARLILAGRAPTQAVRDCANDQIHVTGDVADMRDLYARASVVAAPIFWGSGVRIKILEALACGLPLVTTSLAAEGIDLQHETDALFANDASSFAAALVRVLNHAELRQRLGDAGRAVIEREYDWHQIGARLTQLYQQL